MGIEKQTPGALTAQDKVEGKSEQGKAAFRKLCEGLTEKQKSDMNLGRVLNEDAKEVRRVTRDLIMKIFEFRNVDKQTRKKFWLEYFGGPPPDIAEFVRRRIIQEGNIRAYGERIGLSHATLGNILDTHMISYESLRKLRKANEPFPWRKKELLKRWRGLSTAYRMSDEERPLNEMAARIETLFEMRPTASRTQWVDLKNPPVSLENMSQKKRKILMSEVRHGKPVPWEEVDRILVGLNCDLEERMEVASAWIAARHEPPREAVAKTKGTAQSTSKNTNEEDGPEPAQEKRTLQSQTEYPEHLSGKADLHIIASLLTELTGHDASQLESDEHLLKQSVDNALGTPGQIAVTRKRKKKKSDAPAAPTAPAPVPPSSPAASNSQSPVPDAAPESEEPTVTDPAPSGPETSEEPVLPERAPIVLDERTLFGEEDRSEDDEENLMDFSKSPSVWTIGEYARNFLCTESAGYGPNQEEEFTELAAEVNARAPLGINDTANALKMLLYSYGRHQDHPATAALFDAIGTSFLQNDFPAQQLASLLAEESRFRAFLIYYRDSMPESAVTDVFSHLLDLSTLEVSEDFDPNAIVDCDLDYENVIRPRPPEAPPVMLDAHARRRLEQKERGSVQAETVHDLSGALGKRQFDHPAAEREARAGWEAREDDEDEDD